MKKFQVLIVAMPLCTCAQNLIPNPGFEDYENCDQTSVVTAMEFVQHWFNPNGWSSDYFVDYELPCAINVNGETNESWLAPQPFEGDAFVGSFYYLNQLGAGETREYIEVELSEPLLEGHPYEVSWWVSISGKSKYRVDKIGGYFSNEILIDEMQFDAFTAAPQVETSTFFGSNQNWSQIRDTIWANGGERFLTIGCFVPDNQLGLEQIAFGEDLTDGAYYVIDQVQVIPISVGISDPGFFALSPSVRFYSDRIEISAFSGSDLHCSCNSMSGARILSTNHNERKVFIDTRCLVSGIYILQCTQKGKVYSYKFYK
jgi:hypothetical protein